MSYAGVFPALQGSQAACSTPAWPFLRHAGQHDMLITFSVIQVHRCFMWHRDQK